MAQNSGQAGAQKTPDEARQAIETGHMRYVLGVSLTLAALAMFVALMLI